MTGQREWWGYSGREVEDYADHEVKMDTKPAVTSLKRREVPDPLDTKWMDDEECRPPINSGHPTSAHCNCALI